MVMMFDVSQQRASGPAGVGLRDVSGDRAMLSGRAVSVQFHPATWKIECRLVERGSGTYGTNA